MYRFTIGLTVALLATTNLAASPLPRVGQRPATLTDPPRSLQRSPVIKTCKDFSGDWAGLCGSDPEEYTLKLDQVGCFAIVIQDKMYEIGGNNQNQRTTNFLLSTEFTSFDWDETQSDLFMSWHVIDRAFGQRGTTQGRASAHLIKADADTMVIKHVSNWFTDMGDPPWSYDDDSKCVYHRQK